MGITNYSPNRDSNGSIPPGDIRAETFPLQQIVNAIRQLMADIATFFAGPITLPDDLTVTGDLAAGTVSSGGFRIDQWVTIKNEAVSNVTVYDVLNIGSFKRLRINMWLRPVTTDNRVLMRWSSNNGSSFFAGATDYATYLMYSVESTPTTANATGPSTQDRVDFSSTNLIEATGGLAMRLKDVIIDRWNVSNDFKCGQGFMEYHTSTPALLHSFISFRSAHANTLVPMNAFRISLGAAGNFDIDILVEGQL